MSEEKEKRTVQAVFFDAAGTLFHPFPSVGSLYARVAQRYGTTVDPSILDERFQKEFESRGGLRDLEPGTTPGIEKAWWRALVRGVFDGVRVPTPFDQFFDELYDLFATPEAWRFYPEVPGVLKALAEKGLILAIVSNWDSRLPLLCERMNLLPPIRFVIASGMVGAAKPNPAIFQEALKRAAVSPGNVLHVGDSLEEDIQGARSAGIRALWVNRNAPRRSSLIPTIESLNQIVDHLT